MLRSLIVISAILGAGASYAAAVGDACDNTFGDHCGTDGQLQFCNITAPATTGVVAEQDCTLPPTGGGAPAAPGGVCEPSSCVNSSGTTACDTVITNDTCDSPNGQPCGGIAVWFNTDTSDDNFVGFPGCTGEGACITGGTAETCDTSIPACTVGGPPIQCIGDKVVLCILAGGEDKNGNGTLDAGEDTNGNGVLDEFIAPGAVGLDCATALTAPSTCGASLTDGPMHQALAGLGAIQGNEPLPDCNAPAEGEGEGGAGEGEGEGTAACTQNSECGRDKVCDNGTCKDKTDTGSAAPSCSDTGAGTAAPLAGLVAIVALGGLFRRRRA